MGKCIFISSCFYSYGLSRIVFRILIHLSPTFITSLISSITFQHHSSHFILYIPVLINKRYDVSKFLSEHPGGKKVVLRVAGKDATKEFNKFHNVAAVLQKYGPQLCINHVLPFCSNV